MWGLHKGEEASSPRRMDPTMLLQRPRAPARTENMHCCGRCFKGLQATGGMIRQRPYVAIVPLLLLVLMIGLGVFGIKMADKAHQESIQDDARVLADSFGRGLQLSFSFMWLPLAQLSALVEQVPEYLAFTRALTLAAPAVLQAASATATISVSPMGHISTSLPSSPGGLQATGVDLLGVPSIRPTTLRVMQHLDYAKTGPVVAISPPIPQFAILSIPVFVKNVSADAVNTWHIPWNATRPPADIYYNPTTRTQWWGLVSIFLDMMDNPTLQETINQVHFSGFEAQVLRPGNPGEPPLVSLFPKVLLPNNTQQLNITIGDEEWVVCVWPTQATQPAWMPAMYAVVVLGAACIAALLFAMLLSREEHKALLHSLLPKQVIERMRAEAAGAQWANVRQASNLASAISLDTPAQNMLEIIGLGLDNKVASPQLLLAVKDALHRSADVYKPTMEQLKSYMASEALDAEVRQALVAQLVGRSDIHDAVHAPDGRDGLALDFELLAGYKSAAFADTLKFAPSLPSRAGRSFLSPFRISVPLDSMTTDRGSTPGATPRGSQHLLSPAMLDTQRDLTEGMLQLLQLPAMEAADALDVLEDEQVVQELDASQALPMIPEAYGDDHSHSLTLTALVTQTTFTDTRTPRMTPLICGPDRLSTFPDPILLQTDMFRGSAPPEAILLKLDRVLANASSWTFNVFELDAATNGRPLSALGFWLLTTTGLKAWAGMDNSKLVRFLHKVEDNYAANPYHNRRHAANVLQCLHAVLLRGGFKLGFMDNLTMLACYLAAIIHDVGHKGCNNDYLVNAHDDLAVLYNDRSPMENHHLAVAFGWLKQAQYNCLSGLSKAQWTKLRKLAIDLVLATDMKAHFTTLGHFQAQVQNDMALGNSSSGERTISGGGATDEQAGGRKASLQPAMSDCDKVICLQMALKVSDVGHCAMPLNSHLKWVRSLEEEFWQQGDAERAAGLTISPLCDRNKEGVTKSQVGFFDFVVMPLYKAFCTRFEGAQPLLTALLTNYEYWAELASKKSLGPPSPTSPSSRAEPHP